MVYLRQFFSPPWKWSEIIANIIARKDCLLGPFSRQILLLLCLYLAESFKSSSVRTIQLFSLKGQWRYNWIRKDQFHFPTVIIWYLFKKHSVTPGLLNSLLHSSTCAKTHTPTHCRHGGGSRRLSEIELNIQENLDFNSMLTMARLFVC